MMGGRTITQEKDNALYSKLNYVLENRKNELSGNKNIENKLELRGTFQCVSSFLQSNLYTRIDTYTTSRDLC